MELLPIAQLARLQHLLDHPRAARTGVVEILVPQRQVLDCRQEAGSTYGVEIRDADSESILRGHVTVSHVLDDLGVVVAEVRVLHAERLEDARRGKLPKRLAAHAFYYLGQQCVARIAVHMFGTGRE